MISAFTQICLVNSRAYLRIIDWYKQPFTFLKYVVLLWLVLFNSVPAASATLNPTGRVLSLHTPLSLNGSMLGGLLTTIGIDDSISFSTEALLSLLAQHVSAPTLEKIGKASEAGVITLSALTAEGITTEFDLSTLAVIMVVPASQLGRTDLVLRPQYNINVDVSEPTTLSGSLNARVLASRTDDASAEATQNRLITTLDGSLKIAGPVLSFGLSAENNDSSTTNSRAKLSRTYTRLDIDIPDKETRLTFGDIDIAGSTLFGSSAAVGFSVGRDFAFSPNRNIRPTGQREFSLARPSTVTVMSDGARIQSFRLVAGNYNLSDLPLVEGSNNFRLLVEDDTGLEDEIDFSTFFTSNLLAPGELDYTFSTGFLSSSQDGHIEYDTDNAALGLSLRYGATSTVTLSHALLASDAVAMIDSEWLIATRYGSLGSFVGFSQRRSGEGKGWSFGSRFDHLRIANAVSLSVGGDVRSGDFDQALQAIEDVVDDPAAVGRAYSAYVSASSTLPGSVQFNAVASTTRQSDGEASSTVTATASRRARFVNGLFWSLRARHEKRDASAEINSVSISLNYQIDRSHRISSFFSSENRSAEVGISRQHNVGLVGGYEAELTTSIADEQQRSASVMLGYTGNRYAIDIGHSSQIDSGEDERSNDSQIDRSSVRINTAMVFAGRSAAFSRTVGNSFAIVDRHPTLGSRVLRLSPIDEGEVAHSDWLGKAVIPDLGKYRTRTLTYTIDDLPLGYDLGDGAFYVTPPLGAGYNLQVGSAEVMTVVGVIIDAATNEPVTLIAGKAVPLTSSNKEPVIFFTNRTGKFALSGVAAGDYRLELDTTPAKIHVLTIPASTETLFRAGTIEIQ